MFKPQELSIHVCKSKKKFSLTISNILSKLFLKKKKCLLFDGVLVLLTPDINKHFFFNFNTILFLLSISIAVAIVFYWVKKKNLIRKIFMVHKNVFYFLKGQRIYISLVLTIFVFTGFFFLYDNSVFVTLKVCFSVFFLLMLSFNFLSYFRILLRVFRSRRLLKRYVTKVQNSNRGWIIQQLVFLSHFVPVLILFSMVFKSYRYYALISFYFVAFSIMVFFEWKNASLTSQVIYIQVKKPNSLVAVKKKITGLVIFKRS